MRNEAELRRLVERYRVCCDTFPEWSQMNSERYQTGVVVELYGRSKEGASGARSTSRGRPPSSASRRIEWRNAPQTSDRPKGQVLYGSQKFHA